MKILLHSSKTMKPVNYDAQEMTTPRFIHEAAHLHGVLSKMDVPELMRLMDVTETLARQTKELIEQWTHGAASPAALTFRGDIYSGLSAASWDNADKQFAQDHLMILSGLYGVLRPFDGIKPYRLEMGYKVQAAAGLTLTQFWQQTFDGKLDRAEMYVNLTAYEYYKAVEKQLTGATVVAPKFLTLNPKTNQPMFVTVHAKIARGSLANWLIRNKVTDASDIKKYHELNYSYDEQLSTPAQPTFVCADFGGLGLSVRLAP